jgi:multiple sugar transport system permease protein
MDHLSAYARTKRSDAAWGLLFVAAPVLSVLLFVFFPALLSVFISAIEWNGFIPIGEAVFVGFRNFAAFLSNGALYTKEFLNSLYVTLILMSFIPFNVIISFLLAFALNRKKTYLKNCLRLIYFLPFVSSAVAITLVFKNIFNMGGAINAGLAVLGIGPMDWLRSPHLSRLVIVAMLIWRNIGYTMLMYLAALQGIPQEVYEAARIDGAGVTKTIAKITLPALSNVSFFLVVTNIISGLQIYTEPVILFQSSFGKGPLNGTESMMIFLMYLYGNNNLGLSSAISWAITVLILLATFIQFAYRKARNQD